MRKDPKNIVEEMVEEIGKRKTERLLIGANVSPSVASKLVRGVYPSEIGELIAAAIREARKRTAENAS